MKIRGNNVGGKAVQQSGGKGQVSSSKKSGSKTSASSSSGNSDQVSLTTAAKVEELTSQVENLPITDASRINEIQQQLGTGSYEADEKSAANNLIEIEKGLSAEG